MKPRFATAATVLAATALPLIYLPGVYDFTRWPRLLLLQIVTAALLMVWITGGVRRVLPASSKMILPLGAFVGWQLLSILWATNSVEGLHRGSQLLTFGFFSLLTLLTLDRAAIRVVTVCTAIALGTVSLIAVCQYWGVAFDSIPTAGNPSATFGYRNYLATYIVVALPPVGYLALADHNRRIRLFTGVASLIGVTALLCTRTRGAWAALAMAGILGAGLILRRHRDRLISLLTPKRVIGLALSLIAAATLGLQAPKMENQGQFKIDEQKSNALTALGSTFSLASSRGRTTVWSNTLDMISDHPLAGVGLGGWQFTYPRYDRGEWITDNVAPQRPHNDVLWLLAETGLIGFGLYAWLLISVGNLVLGNRETQQPGMAIAFGLGIVAYCTHSLFSFPLERVASTATMWFGLGAIGVLTASCKTPERDHRLPSWLAYPALAALLLSAGLTVQRLQFDWHYARAIEAWKRHDWHSVVQEAEQSLSIGSHDFRAYQLAGAGYQKTGKLPEARDAFTKSLAYHPDEGHLPLANVLMHLGAVQEAADHYRIESELYPHRVAPLIGLAKTARAQSLWDEVHRTALRVIEKDRNNAEANLLLLDALEGNGDLVSARALLEKLLLSKAASSQLYTRYGSILSKAGKWKEALRAHNRASGMSPTDPRPYNNTGVAHTRLGEFNQSVAAFERAIEVDSSYSTAYRNLGDALERTGRKDEAIKAYKGFVRHWRGSAEHRVWAEKQIKKLVSSP